MYDPHPNLMYDACARMEVKAHLAILKLLFFSSVARMAPFCCSNFFLQSMPDEA